MSKKWLAVIGAAALAGLLLAGMAGLALAQGPQPGQGTPGQGFGWGCGGYGMMGSGSRWDMHQAMWEAEAKALGLTTDQLAAEFQAGKTLSQVAKEHNVEVANPKTGRFDAGSHGRHVAGLRRLRLRSRPRWVDDGVRLGTWPGDDGFRLGAWPRDDGPGLPDAALSVRTGDTDLAGKPVRSFSASRLTKQAISYTL
jgi:hypothetical protein